VRATTALLLTIATVTACKRAGEQPAHKGQPKAAVSPIRSAPKPLPKAKPEPKRS